MAASISLLSSSEDVFECRLLMHLQGFGKTEGIPSQKAVQGLSPIGCIGHRPGRDRQPFPPPSVPPTLAAMLCSEK